MEEKDEPGSIPPGGGNSQGYWTFHVDFRRYNTTVCTYQLMERLQTQGRKIGDGDCHTWDDGESFVGFTYSWLFHIKGEELEEYGRCNVLAFTEEHCQGSRL